MNVVEIVEGTGPVVLAMPHGGTSIPVEIERRLNARGRELTDTDWHIARLYDGLLPRATTVRATFHRYVIDANRDPEDVSLYPGRNTTSLCPVTDFDGRAIWRDGAAPGSDEIAARRWDFHAPYHRALGEQIERVRAAHGVAVLYDCHSIRSRIPFLFEGTLPVFNIGTAGGQSCAAEIEQEAVQNCAAADAYDHILNGRFKGGWTTRRYGRPARGVHAIQMELAQRAYMDEAAPWTYREERAAAVRPYLQTLLQRLERLALDGRLQDQRSATDVRSTHEQP